MKGALPAFEELDKKCLTQLYGALAQEKGPEASELAHKDEQGSSGLAHEDEQESSELARKDGQGLGSSELAHEKGPESSECKYHIGKSQNYPIES